ncbi:SDR family oxidoreductase [Consotaella aegiceratis]|uniref:SDR family oxidoreductase n=1 Tax=Consotaella aegiceratis TaxID=3097961 RepID=UPI002F3F5E5D
MPLSLSSATVLITGGSTGIGLALALHFQKAGGTVIVTGRSRARLNDVVKAHPGLVPMVSDVGKPKEREALAATLRHEHPRLNVVINNAGIQRRIALAEDAAPWPERQREIDVLLSGPIHLNHLLVPPLLAQGQPALIANVTSGGAYVPQPFAPVYSACKAALHSYTVTLQHALEGTPCRVVEIVPPAVQTGLAGPDASHGAPLDDFAAAVFQKLAQTEDDTIGFGMTDTDAFHVAAAPLAAMFEALANRFPVKTYG